MSGRTAFGCALGVALAILISHRPDALQNPQFWAEDGSVFFADAYNFGPFRSLLKTHRGYLSHGPRVAASAAMLVPLPYGPLALNLVALGVQLGIAGFLMSGRFARLVPSITLRFVLAFLYLSLPNVYEIHSSITNSQWQLALFGCLVVLAPGSSRAGRALDLTIVLFAAFSGPCSFGLLGIALLHWLATRDPKLLPICAALAFVSIVQAAVLLSAMSIRGSEPLGASPGLFLQIVSGQIFLGATLGMSGTTWIRSLAAFEPIAVAAFALGSVVFATALWKAPLELRLFTLYAFSILAMAMISPSGPWRNLAAPGASVRYWFLPMLAFQTCALWLACRKGASLSRALGMGLLVLMCWGIAADWRHPRFADLRYAAHIERLRNAPAGSEVRIPINPRGWLMTLQKH